VRDHTRGWHPASPVSHLFFQIVEVAAILNIAQQATGGDGHRSGTSASILLQEVLSEVRCKRRGDGSFVLGGKDGRKR